jgi:hypothetical protein
VVTLVGGGIPVGRIFLRVMREGVVISQGQLNLDIAKAVARVRVVMTLLVGLVVTFLLIVAVMVS